MRGWQMTSRCETMWVRQNRKENELELDVRQKRETNIKYQRQHPSPTLRTAINKSKTDVLTTILVFRSSSNKQTKTLSLN